MTIFQIIPTTKSNSCKVIKAITKVLQYMWDNHSCFHFNKKQASNPNLISPKFLFLSTYIKLDILSEILKPQEKHMVLHVFFFRKKIRNFRKNWNILSIDFLFKLKLFFTNWTIYSALFILQSAYKMYSLVSLWNWKVYMSLTKEEKMAACWKHPVLGVYPTLGV